jgi:putative ABC transport system permease protein
MRAMRDWHTYVRSHLNLPSHSPERHARIVRELATQMEDFYRDALAGGLSEEEADGHARSQITDWDRIARDVSRADRAYRQPRLVRLADALDATPGPSRGMMQMFSHVIRDVRFAMRQLVKSPGFSIVAVLTLALGIGSSSAIFSVVNGVLLRPLPYPDADRLVRVHELVPNYGRFSVAPATFLDWRQQNTSFDQIAAYTNTSGTLIWDDGPERVLGASVSWDLFALLKVSPEVGGGFVADQDRPGGENVIVLSHGLWQRRFGGDRSVVGRTITMSGTPLTVLGVMPADFYFPSRTVEFWRPIAINPADATRGGHYLGVIARTKAGITVDQARVEMKAVSERLALQYPEDSANESADVINLREQIVGTIRPALLTLLAAVGVVVLIACANVANLLLVRASAREREIAIRTALGAGRRRLVLQMLSESLVLSFTGGALGLLLAYLAIPAIQTLSAGSIPRVADIAIDTSVLLFTLAASLVTGVTFGLVPAWQTSRGGSSAVLKEGGRSSVGSGSRWMRSALLVGEVALSLVLLVGAALLLRSFTKLTTVDPGFSADGVLAFQVTLPGASYKGDEVVLTSFDRLLDRLATVPSVTAASGVQTLPMRGNYVLSYEVLGEPKPKPGDEPSANHRAVTPDYFKALGIPLRQGRTFTRTDAASSAKVTIIDEAFARRHFASGNAIGRRLNIGNGTDGAEIIGIVGSVNYNGLDATPSPTMYVPLQQDVFNTLWFMVKTTGDPMALARTVRQVVRDMDKALPTYSMTALSDVVSESVAQQRFSMLLILLFGLVALFLSAVGLYGVVAYTVSLRTREIGLRMAIGAMPSDVQKMIIGGGMRLAAFGVGLGILAALALSQLVKSMLFEVEPSDPVSYAATAALLLSIAALACYIPARRAMRVDPMVTLQQD